MSSERPCLGFPCNRLLGLTFGLRVAMRGKPQLENADMCSRWIPRIAAEPIPTQIVRRLDA
eukprot:2543236-Amphidinium_carterae.3